MQGFQDMADIREEETKKLTDAMIFKTMVETILGKEELNQRMKIDFLRYSFENHDQLIEIINSLILSNELEKSEGEVIISALKGES
ncbi:MAG: hypothetical protein D6732_02600 [Methanobacteriota archaeon]|nr:MAG: hypothetical protein D6732_02600 [Euryarchaeota archaeon]